MTAEEQIIHAEAIRGFAESIIDLKKKHPDGDVCTGHLRAIVECVLVLDCMGKKELGEYLSQIQVHYEPKERLPNK